MSTGSCKLVLADAQRYWAPGAAHFLRARARGARVLVAVFQEPGGRIGFDQNAIGERVFSAIVGEAYSWCPERESLARLMSESPTDYVRSLIVAGLRIPITIASSRALAPPSPADLPTESQLRTLAGLSLLDVDEQSTEFARGISILAEEFDRICVHSVAQWETTIVTSHGQEFLDDIRAVCKAAEVDFLEVDDDRLLPQW